MAKQRLRTSYHNGKTAYQAYGTQARVYLERLGLTWFKLPVAVDEGQDHARRLTMSRVAELHGVPGSFLWGRRVAHQAAQQLVSSGPADDADTEHWADALLKCPTSSLNHRTVRIAGKPYHWRQDYTGQLRLAAGESPW